MGQTGGRDSNGQRFKPDLWPNLYTKAFQYLITLKLCAAGEYAAGAYQYTRRRRILKREAERCEGKKNEKTDGRTDNFGRRLARPQNTSKAWRLLRHPAAFTT